MRKDPELVKDRTEELADLSLALWSAGIEYVLTEEGWPCEHEGWLHFANPDVGANTYPELDEWDVPVGMVMTRLDD